MGRQQYLTRLAIGRSALQSPEDDEGIHEVEALGSAAHREHVDHEGGYIQQYNSRGRPINPATEARNAEMRRAQNSILALVGVVEDRDRLQQTTEREGRRRREDRQELLRAENDRGSELELLAEACFPVATWSADCLIQRYLAGYHGTQMSFAAVMAVEWRTAVSSGLKGFFAAMFPGGPAWTLYLAGRLGCTAVLEVLVEEVSKRTWEKHRKVKTQRRLDRMFQWVAVGLTLCTEALLLPLCYYATAQSLGIAPASRLTPPWRSYLPQHPTSFHQFGWRPLLSVPFVRYLTSPAVLLLSYRFIVNEMFLDMQTMEPPISSGLTSFRYPTINEASILFDKPAFIRDPIGWVLYEAYDLRASLLTWCGWKVIALGDTTSDVHLEHDVSLDMGARGFTVASTHRSTVLARLQAQHVAASVDRLLTKLFILPFETLVIRAVATSYLDSPLPKTAEALSIGPQLYAPFSGRLLQWLRAPSITSAAIWDTARYASKVGLSVALHVAIQTSILAALYGLARWQGVTRFGWGRHSKTRKK